MRKLKLLIAAAALLVGVGAQAQKDVTSQYITNATLSSLSGWTATHTKTTVTNDPADAFTVSTRGNNTVGYATEAYAGWGSLIQTAYSMKQTITLPAGNYRLVNYSFYRQGGGANDNPSKSLAYLVAGEQKVALKTLGSIVAAAGYADSQAEGANVFDSKMYRNVIEFSIAADNTPIEIGVEGTFDEAKCWCIVGQFELFDLDDLASVSSPTDVTYAITNPGFEYRNLTGWSNNITVGNNTYANNNNWGQKAGIGFYESWRNNVALGNAGTFTQTLSDMPAGLYELSVYAQNIEQYNSNAGGTGMFLTANSDQTEIGSSKQYKVRTTLQNDGDLTIGIKLDNCTGNWIAFDRFELLFYGDPLDAYKDLLSEAVTAAQALIDGDAGAAISTTAKAAWQAVVNANDNDDNAFTEESEFNEAIANITNANTNYQAMAAPYAAFDAMKTKANGLKSQTTAYTDPGTAVSTLESAISTANTAVEAALTPDAINTQIENVRKAAFAFLGNVTLNENSTIDITAFITNAGFDDALTTGWNISGFGAYDGNNNTWHSYSTSYSCGEFYQAKFDISQTLTDLPAGKSFKLMVQAFQRPGDIAAVYSAYGDSENKTKNVTSEIYVNSKSQKIKNIASEYSVTELFDGTGLDAWTRDSNPATGVYVPNSMKGASVYFATDYTSGVKFYESEVAAAADDHGTLVFGFRDNTSAAAAWTIFDNFRLYYVGDDLSGFATDLTAVIASVKTAIDGMTISDKAKTMFKGLADSYEQTYSSAADYTAAISDVNSVETKASSFAAALTTQITDNVGEGVFQYNSTTNNKLWSAYSTAVSAVENFSGTTLSEVETLVDAVETAADSYINQELNAPTSTTHYNLVVATSGHTKNGNAIVIVPGSTSGNNPTGYGLNANFAINSNLAQAVTFTQVSDNNYNISFETADGTAYLTYGATNGSTADHKNYQIQATTDDSKKGEFKIAASTTTANVFNIINTITETSVDCQDGGNIYTEDGKTEFKLSEATQASVAVAIDSDVKYATRIFPFTPTALTGVKFFECTSTSEGILQLAEVTNPAANTPYVLYAENGYTGSALAGWGTAAATTCENNMLTGVYVDTKAPKDSYVLQNNTKNGVGFYKVVENSEPTVTANRCYLTVPNSSRAAFFFSTEATGIEAINALTSGEVEIYNAAGARVPALQKGINIIKTKSGASHKVMVK